MHRPAFGRTDWENLSSHEPDTYHITIFSIDYSRSSLGEMDEEVATVGHRTCGGAYPLLGEAAERSILNADMIVAALNAYKEN